MPAPSSLVRDAYAFCRAKAFGHYENFPVASLLLPQPQRDAVAAVYAFARQADDFSDEPEYAGRRARLLKTWAASLDKAPQGPVFVALADAMQRFGLQARLLKDLVAAFLQDTWKKRYASVAELLGYCRCSADPIGRLVLRVFAADEPEACAESDAICTALQLTNHWQDLGRDMRERSRFYLPQDELRAFGVFEADLKDGVARPALRELIRQECSRAEAGFAAGEGLPRRLGGRLGLEIRLTLLGGRRILERIRRQGYDTLARRPALGLADAPALSWRFLLGRLA